MANSAPSAASICGRTAAHPIASSSRRASLTGASSGGRSIAIPTASATRVASASEMTVTCLRSTSGTPPGCTLLNSKVPSTVMTGMVSAGMKSLFPQRLALSACASRDEPSCFPCPRPRILATRTIAITRKPLTRSGRYDPTRKVSEYIPQNAVLLRRRGFVASRAFTSATPAIISPLSQ